MKFKKLLPENPSVKAVLNGGHTELDDATVPFTLAFDENVAAKKPTHVLVITVPYSSYEKRDDVSYLDLDHHQIEQGGDRKIYELSKVDFLQFHKPGKQNVIFVLISYISKETSKKILQKRDLSSYYENSIQLKSIVDNGISAVTIVGYYEELVDIPEQFFSIIPETGYKKVLWNWVNRWYQSNPVDECQLRERKLIAYSIQPFAWLLGFILRLVFVILADVVFLVSSVLCFLGGIQIGKQYIKEFMIKYNWKFLFKYPYVSWSRAFSFSDLPIYDYNETKEYHFKENIIKIPISPLGLLVQLVLWGTFFFTSYSLIFSPLKGDQLILIIPCFIASGIVLGTALLHLFLVVIDTMPYEKTKRWCERHLDNSAEDDEDEKSRAFQFLSGYWMMSMGILALLGSIFRIPWLKCSTVVVSGATNHSYGLVVLIGLVAIFWFRKKIGTKIASIYNAVMKRIDARLASIPKSSPSPISNSPKKSLTLTEWYSENMNIKDVPAKVDFAKVMVAPTKKQEIALKFKVSFWRMKTKVCRPFAKV